MLKNSVNGSHDFSSSLFSHSWVCKLVVKVVNISETWISSPILVEWRIRVRSPYRANYSLQSCEKPPLIWLYLSIHLLIVFCVKRDSFFFYTGYQYGMMSAKSMISSLLRHFKFSTNLKLSELQMQFQITLKLCNKHMVGVEKRDW